MTRAPRGPGAAPLALRLLHGIVFAALAAAALLRAASEWRHLAFALSGPLHFGPPPSPVLLLASLLALLGAGVLLAALLRRRAAPLTGSALVLSGCMLSLLPSPVREGSGSFERANALLLSCAQAVKAAMVTQLEASADVPDAPAWRQLVEETCPGTFRSRTFEPSPPQLHWLAEERLPEAVSPGTLSVYRSPDRVRFGLHPTGWGASGEASALTDVAGDPLWLRGAILPQL